MQPACARASMHARLRPSAHPIPAIHTHPAAPPCLCDHSESPRAKAVKKLQRLRNQLNRLKANVSAAGGAGAFGFAQQHAALGSDGTQTVTSTTAATASVRGRRGRVVRAGGGYPWSAHVDKDNGRTYYWNKVTDQSQWNPPAGWQVLVPMLSSACACVHISTFICMCADIHSYVHTHARTHARTHTHTHTHVQHINTQTHAHTHTYNI